MKDKRTLIRIVRTPEGSFKLDPTGKANGRGAYICKNATCLAAAQKSKGLERSFKTSIPESIYSQLKTELIAFDATQTNG